MSQQNAPEIVECGSSFEQNAALKALTVSRCFPNELVIADDSGLEVDVLKRTPGIYVAGFMGSGKSTVGRRLAGELGWSFFDADDEIDRPDL